MVKGESRHGVENSERVQQGVAWVRFAGFGDAGGERVRLGANS
jgi:hypothetical protein